MGSFGCLRVCPVLLSMLPLPNDLSVGVTRSSLSTSDGGVANRAPEESMLSTGPSLTACSRGSWPSRRHIVFYQKGYALVAKLC